MRRRDPDLIAVIAIALYLVLGNAGPSPPDLGLPPASVVRDEMRSVFQSGLREVLDQLSLLVFR